MPSNPREARRQSHTSPRDDSAKAELARLRNLGPASAALLVAAGIRDADELRTLGAAAAFRRVLFSRGRSISTNLLWAIEGALSNVRWDQLDVAVRARLLAEVEAQDAT